MTGKKLTREDLTLVSDFSRSQYPYAHVIPFEDHLDGADRQDKRQALIGALRLAGVRDYKIFDNYYDAELRLRTEEEFDRVSVALRPDGIIEQGFAIAPEGYDFRKLKHHRHVLQRIISKTPLVGQVHIDVDREERALVVIAKNKHAYLGFRILMDEGPSLSF